MPEIPRVASTAERLITLLTQGGFNYAIMGGLAVVLHGYDRYTRDIDALVWDLDSRLGDFMRLLDGHGFRLASSDTQNPLSGRILHLVSSDGTPVDIFLGFLPFEEESISRAVSMNLRPGSAAYVVSVEDLIIMKLIASRERDIQDVIGLVDLHPDLDRVRITRIVSEYAEFLERPDILGNLRKLIR